MMQETLPKDFQDCIQFHGHLCPGLSIGYAAVKAAEPKLGLLKSQDEEIIAIVENDSCAVDAIQVLLSCTFGKGNLIFRDWGKQVYTFANRLSGKAVRVSLIGKMPGGEEREALRKKMISGNLTEAESTRFGALKAEASRSIIEMDPTELFKVEEIELEMPPKAQIVETASCSICGEHVMKSRMDGPEDSPTCKECAQKT